jgi:hypothetical protein
VAFGVPLDVPFVRMLSPHPSVDAVAVILSFEELFIGKECCCELLVVVVVVVVVEFVLLNRDVLLFGGMDPFDDKGV